MRKRTKETLGQIAFFVLVILIAVWFIKGISSVQITHSDDLHQKRSSTLDTMMIDNRHMGYISYGRFKTLTEEKMKDLDNIIWEERGDSVEVKTRYVHYFLGQKNHNNYLWDKQYKNIPIRITNSGFVAKLDKDKEYIYIPYLILANIANIGN